MCISLCVYVCVWPKLFFLFSSFVYIKKQNYSNVYTNGQVTKNKFKYPFENLEYFT